METRRAPKLLLWFSCSHIVLAADLTITLDVSGTALYRTTPANVMLSQVINLVCTNEQTAVYNVNKTQYETCTQPAEPQNVHIGDCHLGSLLIVVKSNILSNTVNYRAGGTFYYGVYSSVHDTITGTGPCQNGIKFILHVVDETTITTSSMVTSLTTILSSTPTPTLPSAHNGSLIYHTGSRSLTSTTLITIVRNTMPPDQSRTAITRPICTGLSEPESGLSIAVVAGASIGVLVVIAMVVIMSIIGVVVFRKKNEKSRNYFITTEGLEELTDSSATSTRPAIHHNAQIAATHRHSVEQELPTLNHVLSREEAITHILPNEPSFETISCTYEIPEQRNNTVKQQQDPLSACSERIIVEGSASYQPLNKATIDDMSIYTRPGAVMDKENAPMVQVDNNLYAIVDKKNMEKHLYASLVKYTLV